jgi:hypothetical protein
MTGPGPAGAALLQATGGKCACRACLVARDDRDATGWPISMGMMIVCTKCGNKRCPHSYNHENACTGSNAPGQVGAEA